MRRLVVAVVAAVATLLFQQSRAEAQVQPMCAPACTGVTVTPVPATVTRDANTSGHTATFFVWNGRTYDVDGGLTCTSSGTASCGTVTPAGLSLGASQGDTVRVTYAVGAASSGAITLTYSHDGAPPTASNSSQTITVQAGRSVSVVPDGSTTPIRLANTSGYTEQFTVTNTGGLADTYSLACGGTNGISCSSLSSASISLNAGGQTTVTATYATGNPATGALTLTATGTGVSDNGSFTVPVVRYGVSVTPDGAAAPDRPINTSGHTAVFSVENTGSTTRTVTFSCGATGPVTCSSLSQASTLLNAGASIAVTATYAVGAVGTGTVTLNASDGVASDPGSFTVAAVHYQVDVTPDGAPVTRTAGTGGHTAAFTVTNAGSASASFDLSYSCTGNVSCTGISAPSVTLGAGAFSNGTVTYSVGSAGTGTITVTAASAQASDQGSFAITVVSYGVAVTPDAQPLEVPANTAGLQAVFTITNTGSSTETLSIGDCGSGTVLCTGLTPQSATLAPGASTTATVTYTSGATGAGTVRLVASHAQASDAGTYALSQQAYSVSVAPPVGTWAPNARLINSTGFSESFTVTNTGTNAQTFGLSCTGLNGITCGTVSPSSVALGSGQSQGVTVNYSTGAQAMTGTLRLTASNAVASGMGQYYINQTEPTPPLIRILAHTFASRTTSPETGPFTYTVTVQNQGGLTGNVQVGCSSVPVQVTCTATPATFQLPGAASQVVTIGYTTGGLGVFQHKAVAGTGSELPGSADSVTNGTITVVGAAITQHLHPAEGADYASADTLSAAYAHASGIIPGTVRVFIDGKDSTARATITATGLRAPLRLADGNHRWLTYACSQSGRCDSVATTIRALGVSNVALDDSLPGAPAGPSGWLLGPLELPPAAQRGCTVSAGGPEIALVTPRSFLTQSAPGGRVFVAAVDTNPVLRITTQTMAWLNGSRICEDLSYLPRGSFNGSMFSSGSLTDPLWSSYPWGDLSLRDELDAEFEDGMEYAMASGPSRGATGTRLGTGAGLFSRLRSVLTRDGARPRLAGTGSRAPRAGRALRVPDPGPIDTMSLRIELNGFTIVNGSQPQYAGVTVVGRERVGQTVDVLGTIPQLYTTTQGGWNELIASIADTAGRRTYIRTRFVYLPGGAAPGSIASVGVKPLRDFRKQDQGECAAFGVFQCDGVFLTHAIPGFVTRDRDRSLHLVYRSGSQRAPTLLPLELSVLASQRAPDSIHVTPLVDGAATGRTTRWAGRAGPVSGVGSTNLNERWDEKRIAGGELDSLGGGAAWIKQVTHRVRSFYPGVPFVDDTVSQPVVQLYLSDTTATRFGQGWQLADVQRLVLSTAEAGGLRYQGDTAAIWVQGDGSYGVFRKPGASWMAPPGETARLVWQASLVSNARYILFLENGASIGFANDGWQVWTRDLIGNQTTFTWNATSKRLTAIADPTGKKYVFTYFSGGRRRGLIRDVRVQRSALASDTVTVASLDYDTTAGASPNVARLAKVKIWRGVSQADSTRYVYRSGAPYGAFVDSVVDPRYTPTRKSALTFTYDAALYTPESVRQPPGVAGGVGLAANIRTPWRRALPRNGYGRGAQALERMPQTTQWIGTSLPFAGTATDYLVDRFGYPTYVRAIDSDPAAFGSASDQIRHIERDTLGRVTRVVLNRHAPTTTDSVSYVYDALSRVTKVYRATRAYPDPAPTAPDSLLFTYDSVTLAPNGAWCSRLRSSRDPLGAISTAQYGQAADAGRCLPSAAIGTANDTTLFAYGGLTAGTAAGARPIRTRDPNGLADSVTYHATTWNSERHIRLADGATSRAFYDLMGRMDSASDPLGTMTRLLRDRSGRVTHQKTGTGATAPVARTIYDAGGLVVQTDVYAADNQSLDSPLGVVQSSRTFYDIMGRVDSLLHPGSRTVGADGSQARKQSWALRDGFGNPRFEYRGNGSAIIRSYDGQGRVKRQEHTQVGAWFSLDGERFADTASRNWYGRLALATGRGQSAGQVHSYSYDGAGRLRSTTSKDLFLATGLDSLYATRAYGYGRSGAVVADTLLFEDGAAVIRRYQYNRRGQRTLAVDTVFVPGGVALGEAIGQIRYVYATATGRLDSMIGEAKIGGLLRPYARIGFTYDRGGRLVGRNVALDSASSAELQSVLHYDSRGRLDSLRTSHSLGSGGTRPEYRFGNASYTLVDDLVSYITDEPTAPGANTTGLHEHDYAADGTRRLLRSATGEVTKQWTYDVLGNRLTETYTNASDQCTGVRSFGFGSDNRIVTRSALPGQPDCGLTRYYTDQAGHRLADADTTYSVPPNQLPLTQVRSVMTYTAAGQLYFALSPTGTANAYDVTWHWYDAQGLRVRSHLWSKQPTQDLFPLPHPDSIGGERSLYVYDGADVALELKRIGGTWQVARRNLVGGVDEILAGRYVVVTQAKSLALLTDRQGTVLSVLKPDGTVEASNYAKRDVFGAILGAAGGGGQNATGSGFTGAGAPSASGGFTYLRNRWYDPATGRFLTQDPIGLAGGVNLYAYAGGNPITFSDPFGLMDVKYADKQSEEDAKALAAKSPKFAKALKKLDDDRSVLVIVGRGNTAETSCGSVRRTGGCTRVMLDPSQGYSKEYRIVLDPTGLELDRLANPDDYFDMQTVVGHEVYGHVVPHVGGTICNDAPSGTPGNQVCSVKRENDIRKEMGVPKRRRY